MQGMMRGKSGQKQRGAKVGQHGRNAQEISGVLAAAAAAGIYGNGLGMYGSNKEEMEVLVDMMTQYLESRNMAARVGGASAPYDQLKKSTYNHGNEYVYNFYKHMGPYRLTTDIYKDSTKYQGKTHGPEIDPTFAMMDDFLRDADN